ncbi:MBL fold metallo-hydrolase [Paraclostridium sordellii]|uniref:MBL fold metallo-hydrolase n=1 Tax=Paraclostridium sordellii TaxID=1505 RepID=UPI0005E8D08B|nr:MBL fold metallo-hydrolase [Paeniclostridium sordellii]CEO14275.1 hydrolase beta-lactamase-like [[Clostridium] sordellii] [Paeniclostridium sordellii]CEP89510.1 hydrolase beta-lactamase-like [[Clostridium] sordellii] [Paeniclostridium sordellii]CEP98027.1 hydrolase beta-lactamase-like [[Clostridium] sordellii] [Paeniclostridium sordellii]CEQ01418.1 hydrolase beta-lactamase-like [[Clostridium] sordellii] [Paeniclostridium sordellii]
MIIEKFVDHYFGENTYLIADKDTREGAVIDPGGDIKDLLRYMEDNFINVKYIILTHGHGDHIGCVPELKKFTGACIIANSNEKEILLDKKKNLSYRMNCGATEFDADKYVNDGDSINLGDLKLKFIYTPGHTKGGMCVRVGNHMFTGDTLFAGSMGRTDLYSGDNKQMQKSLSRLRNYEDDIIVYPGHGPNTTMGIEKTTNPYMAK